MKRTPGQNYRDSQRPRATTKSPTPLGLDPVSSVSTSRGEVMSSSSSPISTAAKAPDHFPANRYQAQNDPDYARSNKESAGQSSPGRLRTAYKQSQELFHSTLRKKSRNPVSPPPQTSSKLADQAQAKPSNPNDQAPKTTSKAKEEKRMYNEGYQERMKRVEDSRLFFRLPLDYQNTVQALQNIYSTISELEARQKISFEQLNSAPVELFDEEEWNAFNKQQAQLVVLYSDFMHYAYCPSEKVSQTKRLVNKYKIPSRLWNHGILHYVEALRKRAPRSKSLLARFVIHCMSLLMLFTEPIYESRHIWIESLGDLSMLCLMSNVKACAEWREMCMYWYQRRALLTAGTGRLYRHMGTISESKINSLFYACKAMTATQPIEITPPDLMAILHHAIDSGNTPEIESKRLEDNESSAVTTYINWHSQIMGLTEEVPNPALREVVTRDFCAGNSRIVTHGTVIIALCNIAALLKHGHESSTLSPVLKEAVKNKRSSSSDSSKDKDSSSDDLVPSTPIDDDWLALEPAKQMCFDILSSAIQASDYTAGLQHAIVWLHFLLAMTSVPRPIRDLHIDSNFPMDQLVFYINTLIKLDPRQYYSDPPRVLHSITPRLAAAPETRPPEERLQELIDDAPEEIRDQLCSVPSLMDRPLPEEAHMRGFAWSLLLPTTLKYMNGDVVPVDEPYVGYYGPSYLTETRVKRVLFLAEELEKKGDWIKLDSQSGTYYAVTSDSFSEESMATTP